MFEDDLSSKGIAQSNDEREYKRQKLMIQNIMKEVMNIQNNNKNNDNSGNTFNFHFHIS